jgi:hypothetical protein
VYPAPQLDENGLHWYASPRFALLLAQDGWQVVGIAAVSTNLLSLTEPLARPAHAGATVMPLVIGVAVESGEAAQWLPGVMAGGVTARVAFEQPPDEGMLNDPMLDGFPIWPDGNWRDDPSVTAQAVITQRDLSPADPWIRRNDPWPTTTFQRRYLAVGRVDIARWRARLYRAQGRLGACWIADGLAPVLRVTADADVDDGFVRVDGADLAAFWHRPAGAMILHPDGSRQAVLTATFHHDAGGVLVLRSGLQAPVPSGSRVIRLARCRLDHDAIDLHWHTPELVEIPLTLRLLPPTRGNDVVTSIGS